MRRALAIDEQSFGPDHPNVASRPQQPGAVAPGHQPAGGGRAADAPRPGHRRAESSDPITPTSPSTSTTWRSCSRPRTGWRRPSRLMRRALAIDEQSLRTRSPQRRHTTSTTWRSCSRPRTGWRRPSRLMRRALAIDEQSFGPDHPNVAIDLNNLAQLLQATNRLAEAEPLDAPRPGDRRAELRARSPQRRHPPQQPGAFAPGHEPAGGGRAA